MATRTTKEFQNKILEKITFSPYKNTNYTLYTNKNKPELGYFLKYSRDGYYDFGVGDYTILNDFSLSFEHNEKLIRFGTVYTGETEFEIEDNSISSFSPSSFFTIETQMKGKQTWKKGQHFHGAEITIYKKYLDDIITPAFPKLVDFNKFIINYTYNYLPIKIVSIIQELRSLAERRSLSPLYLESKIIESIAILSDEINSSPENAFSNQINYGSIKIGKDRSLTLTVSDINALQEAHDILSKNMCNPPTIAKLSKLVFLNEQKLKAGFQARYHMSINQYTTSIKMAYAENLLSTTELSVDEISKLVGYNHSSNFVKMFKKIHNKTPLAFRKSKS